MKRFFLIVLMASIMGVAFGQTAGNLLKLTGMAGTKNKVRINQSIDDVNNNYDSITSHNTRIMTNAAVLSGSVATDSVNAHNTRINTNLTDLDVVEDSVAAYAVDFHTGGLYCDSIVIAPTVAEYTVLVSIDSTKFVGNSAGDINHADGAILVAAPGPKSTLEFVSAFFIYDYSTAAFTGGSDDIVVQVGVTGTQVAVSSAITDASLFTASADKMLRLGSTATELVHADVGAISLYGDALTNDGGTAAGVLRVHVTYRKHTTGL